MLHPLLALPYWIFDMDGTLTLAQHDFQAMRAALGLPANQTILESLAALPAQEAAPLYARLQAMELEIAQQAQAAEGAVDLLNYLTEHGAHIGLLTRNSALNIQVTLEAAGLLRFFKAADLISRDCAAPKPSPEGIQRLLHQWQAPAQEAVMVGDYLYDLQAGRAAHTHTLYLDPTGQFPDQAEADVCLQSLLELFN